MNPEAAEAIQIADKYLPDAAPEVRLALAKEIMEAIIRHAETVAKDAVKTAFANARASR